jgi:hypothetical protein
MRSITWSAFAGLVAAAAYVLSPITVVTAALAVVSLRLVVRGLPPGERRYTLGLLALAFALRVAVIGALFLSAPHDSQAIAVLSGDEAQLQSRAMRMRDIVLGQSVDRFDYVVVFDEYGRTSYNTLLAGAQVLFGPSPYGMRVFNAWLFVVAASLLFRAARSAFGSLPALCGLVVLLFVPTLFAWSISLLKESLYCLLTVVTIVSLLAAVRSPGLLARAAAVAVLALALWSLRDLRPGAVVITASGLVLGVAWAALAAQSVRSRAIVAVAVVAIGVAALMRPAVQERVEGGIEAAAMQHAGHVFTVGHSYKLLDDGFYVNPRPLVAPLSLTPSEMGRYLIRAGLSFFLVPLPSQITTRSELAFVPEQLLWYGIVLLAVVGLWTAFRADRLTAALFVSVAGTAALAVAVTNGNVGTLIRFRGLVTPYVVWISAVGFCVTMRRMLPAGALLVADGIDR